MVHVKEGERQEQAEGIPWKKKKSAISILERCFPLSPAAAEYLSSFPCRNLHIHLVGCPLLPKDKGDHWFTLLHHQT